MFSSVVVATFSLWKKGRRTSLNGMIEPLLSYFTPRTRQLYLIDGVHPGSSTTDTYFDSYFGTKRKLRHISAVSKLLSPFLRLQNSNGTQLLFKIRDFLSVFELYSRLKTRTQLFIGLESVYTLAAIILKKLGRIGCVVYYVSDYSPHRFRNPFVNTIYLFLDRLCCYHADYIWDVSPAMHPARISSGLIRGRSVRVIVVPNGLFPNQHFYLDPGKREKNSLVYAGSLGRENGPDLTIRSIPLIAEKFPDVTLHIYGTPEYEEDKLKNMAKRYGVSGHIVFHGLVTDMGKLSRALSHYWLGLAPYRAYHDSVRWYADATKIRLYLGSGLPVITTHVPPLGKTVKSKGAALVICDSEKALARAVMTVLGNNILFRRMCANAKAFSLRNTWENSYDSALSGMGMSPISGQSPSP